jgi:hypothetical protein
MSFTIAPVSESYAPPAVAETEITNDRQHAQQDANHRRHPHRQPETPVSGEQPALTPEPESRRAIGTLIDVRA